MLSSLYRYIEFFISGLRSQTQTPTGGSETGGNAALSFSGGAGFGGSEAGGSDTVVNRSQALASSGGGSESGGEATVSFSFAPTGGSEAGGSGATVGIGGAFAPSGGSEAGGSGTTYSIGAIHTVSFVMSGGSEVSGSAPFNISKAEEVPTGGSEAGGSDTTANLAQTLVSAGGGSESGGTVSYTWQPAGYVPNGGSEAGGETISLRRVKHIPEGGSESGGERPGGGSEAGGFAAFSSTTPSPTWASHTPTGGSEAGGATSLVGPGFVSSGGGSESGGTASISTIVVVSVTPTGGSEATGFAGVAVMKVGDGTGGTTTISTPYHRGPTTRRAVMQAVRRTLVATGQFTSDQVFIKRRREELDLSPPAEPYLTLALGRNRVEQPDFTGGGLYADTRIEVIEVRVYHRLEYDQVQRATEWELDASTGAQRWVLLVSNALHGEEAFDDAGTCLSGQPMRIIDIGDLQPAAQSGWGFVPIFVEILYTAAEVSA